MSPLPTPKTTINPQEQLSIESAQRILAELPEWVVAAILKRATEIEYPVEAVLEMAIASFLDDEALGFSDCLLGQRLKDNG
ncbi:MAG: hypothetical protein LH647_18310 [Leptolyngbyaceae cyanobacterium CAN_BIN12]|nr:hypothetical protein [Leptolyngbyaceae cyanobacterium CAN_BIN12]